MTQKKQKVKKTSFLFGAGASIPSGMPRTSDISNEIFNGCNNWFYSNGEYRLISTSGQSAEYHNASPYRKRPREAGEFINQIKNECELYYSEIIGEPFQTHYEEVYDVIRQLYLSLSRNVDNPVVGSFISVIMPRVAHLWNESSDSGGHISFRDLCDSSMSFIKSIIRDKLGSRNIVTTDYFKFIKNLAENDNISIQSIFTLNHDVTLERFFENHAVKYIDGFRLENDNGIRIWQPSTFRKKNQLKVLKLHGSINWNYIQENQRDGFGEQLMVCFDHYLQEERGTYTFRWKGKDYKESDQLLLTGTNDKYLQYQFGLFVELWNQFHKLLSETELLICIGYGFGDNAVNARIINWMFENKYNKLIVVDINKLEDIEKYARGPISKHLTEWNRNGRIACINKSVGDLDSDELLASIVI